MGAPSSSESGAKPKKKGVIKSITKGISRRRKKKRPDDESVASIALDKDGRRGSSQAKSNQKTVSFNKDDEIMESKRGLGDSAASGPSRASASSMKSSMEPIQVILLLMDPSSRRFELLQLEFDSAKALVRDVLHQIQASATETNLRDMNYSGVCDQDGLEMVLAMKLLRFCKGKDILLAIPKGMTGLQTAKLALPILGDPKVAEMLAPAGVNIGAFKRRSISGEEGRTKSSSKSRGGAVSVTSKKSPPKLPTAILGVLLSILLFLTFQRHVRITKPIESGDILRPGQWKSQCGVFDLLPDTWLDMLPIEKLSPNCATSRSSTLELSQDDGKLRYVKENAAGERKEIWSYSGGNSGTSSCSGGGGMDGECHGEATFTEEGSSWYVDIAGFRTSVGKDVIQDFMSQS